MGADEFVFGRCNITPLITLVEGFAYRFGYVCQLTEFFQLRIHFLVGDHREGLITRKGNILVFVQDSLCYLVEFDPYAIGCLDRCNVDKRILYIAFFQVLHIGVPETGVAAENEDIPDLFS